MSHRAAVPLFFSLLLSAALGNGASASDCYTVDYIDIFPDPGGPGFTWPRNSLMSATLLPYHYVPDIVLGPGENQYFYFHGLYGRGVPTYELFKESITLYSAGSDGSWANVGTDRTTRGGDAAFLLEAPNLLAPGAHHLKAWVSGDQTEANAFAWVWNPGMRAVVTDIDGTCTLDDLQEYLDIIYEIGPLDYVPEEKPGAAAVMQFWADHHVPVVYITARPLYLKQVTIDWLRAKGFPLGPLFLYGASGGILPPLTDAERIRFKSDRLSDLETRAGVRFLAAYGNTDTDAAAYCQALDMPPEHAFIIDCPSCDPTPECAFSTLSDSWWSHLQDLEEMGIPIVPQPCE